MPEIDFLLFDLKQLLRLFKFDFNANQKMREYERHTEECMELNRLKLFTDYGYNNDFNGVFSF
jgi:hypothetical protein